MTRPPVAEARPVRVVTRCASVAEFIHDFCRMVDERHMMVALKTPRARGTRVHFSVHLADGTPVFQGTGPIVDLQPRPGRASVAATIALEVLEQESRTMHTCMLIAGKAPSLMRLPLPPPVEPAAPASAELPVPANPLEHLSLDSLEQFVDVAIHEPPAPPAPEATAAAATAASARAAPTAAPPRASWFLPRIVILLVLATASGLVAAYLLWG